MDVKPGVSHRKVFLSITKNSECLVVCFPLSIFLLISPVSIFALGISKLVIVLFPTPEGPAKATLLPFIRCNNSSIP